MKVSELTGVQLDWVVAKCEAQALLDPHNNEWEYCWNLLGDNSGDYYSPSTNWAHGGPILEQEGIELRKNLQGTPVWAACFYETRVAFDGKSRHYHSQNGPTPLLAAMRCYVMSKLGYEIEIPEELK